MKKIIVLLLLVAVGAAGFGLWQALTLEDRLERELTAIFGVPVQIGSVGLEIFIGQGELSGVEIANVPGATAPAAVRIPTVSIVLEPISLVSGTAHVRELVLVSPQVTLEQTPSGLNLDVLVNQARSHAAQGLPLELESIRLDGGRVVRADDSQASALLSPAQWPGPGLEGVAPVQETTPGMAAPPPVNAPVTPLGAVAAEVLTRLRAAALAAAQ